MDPLVDEKDLIRSARGGDQRAFARLVDRKRDRAFRVAFHIVGDEDDAKDIAQQAFVRLWYALAGFDESQRFDPWFCRIVVNLAIDHHRAERRRGAGTVPLTYETADPASGAGTGAAGGAEAAAARREMREVFRRAAAGLGAVQRAVFTLKEIEGVGTVEIASILGIRESTVRNHLMHARRHLREALRRDFPEYTRGFRS